MFVSNYLFRKKRKFKFSYARKNYFICLNKHLCHSLKTRVVHVKMILVLKDHLTTYLRLHYNKSFNYLCIFCTFTHLQVTCVEKYAMKNFVIYMIENV